MTIIVDAADTPVAKLSLWPAIRLSYATCFQHFRDGLRVAALWLPLVAALTGAASWLQASLLAELAANPHRKIDLAQPVHMLILGNIANLVLTCAAISSAVAWHRLLLLNEAPGRSGGNFSTRNLWRYVGVGIMIGLIAAIPVVGVLLPMSLLGLLPAAGPTPLAVIAVIGLGYVIAIALMLRLCLVLPARASGDLSLTFKEAWRRTRGNVWRIFWGILACGVAPFLVTDLAFMSLVLVPLGNGLYLAQWAFAGAFATCCWLLAWPIWIVFLSLTYRQLVRAA